MIAPAETQSRRFGNVRPGVSRFLDETGLPRLAWLARQLETAIEATGDAVATAVGTAGRGALKGVAGVVAPHSTFMAAIRAAEAQVADILRAEDRCQAGPTAPACGLFLMRVIYP